MNRVSGEAERFLSQGDYEKALEVMAELAGPIDDFFDNVRVLDADERVSANRLALLRSVDSLFRRVADFKIISKGS